MRDIIKISNENNHSKILFIDGSEELINLDPKKFLEKLCLINGCTLDGRINNFKIITGAKQKPCILVNDNLLFIPTMSINNSNCEFIQYNKIVWYKSFEDKTQILFNNGYKLVVDCSLRTLKKQIKRCDYYTGQLLAYEKLTFNSFKGMEDIQ